MLRVMIRVMAIATTSVMVILRVDLLIDDVEGEDADAVELLLPCSRAHRMKSAAV